MPIPYKQPPRLNDDAVRRFSPPPGFRPEDLVVKAVPDTQEMIERSFNPQAKLAFDEVLRLRRLLRQGGG